MQARANKGVVHQTKAIAQGHAHMVGKFNGCRTGATFCAVHHHKVECHARLQHGFDDCKPLSGVSHTQLAARRLATAELAQSRDEFQFNRAVKARMAGRRHTVLLHEHTTCSGDFSADFGFGQHAAVAGLGSLREPEFGHLYDVSRPMQRCAPLHSLSPC